MKYYYDETKKATKLYEPDDTEAYLQMLNQRHADNWRQLVDYLENGSAATPEYFKLILSKQHTLLIVPADDTDTAGLEFDL